MNGTNEAKNGGRPKIPNRQGLYARTAKYAQKAIDTMVSLLESRNEAIRLGAAKALLDKCLPDMKAINDTEGNRQPLLIKIIAGEGYQPPGMLRDSTLNYLQSPKVNS